jgi:hypothetical protein
MKEHKNNKYLVLEVKKVLFRVLKFSFYKDDIDVIYFEEFTDIQKLESLFEDDIEACVISFSKDIDKENIVKIENEIKKLNINFDKNISELQAIYFAIQNFDSSCKYRPYVYPLFNKFFNFRDELNAVLVGCVVYIIEKIKLGQLPVKTEKIIFTKQKLKQIEKLNQFLETIEEKAYNLAKIENQTALKKLQNKENNIDDYELEIQFMFFTKDRKDDGVELLTIIEHVKHHFNKNSEINLNDKENHNVTKSIINSKALNEQKHCWLLHCLYDDYHISWDRILDIDGVYFDINIRLQYDENL